MATRAVSDAKVRARSASNTDAPLPRGSGALGAGVADLLLQRMAGVALGSGAGVVRGRAGTGPRWAGTPWAAGPASAVP